ncbi:MAG: class I SAM-dependent methyltransferase [Phycisphaerales bacterium]|nr:class I SAM-dependent methyltransferase [Phycisphaerales bacterium]
MPGATAEAGVFRGLASRILCLERRREDPDFDGEGHFGVDSFEGLSPPATIDDDPSCAGRFADTSVEMARRTLEGFPAVELIKGWIPEALDQLPDQQYRFVHVDVDLHDPTRASLEYFFPRMVRGGVIVIDDYGPWPNGEFPGCKIAADESVMRHGIGLAALDTGNAVIFKR